MSTCTVEYHRGENSWIVLFFIALSLNAVFGQSETWIEMSSTGNQYWVSSSKKSFNNAEHDCEERDATLAMIKNTEENVFIQSQLLGSINLKDNVFIGLKFLTSHWIYPDGTEYDGSNFSISPWDSDVRNGGFWTWSTCAAIDKNTFLWIRTWCHYTNLYICQRNAPVNGTTTTDTPTPQENNGAITQTGPITELPFPGSESSLMSTKTWTDSPSTGQESVETDVMPYTDTTRQTDCDQEIDYSSDTFLNQTSDNPGSPVAMATISPNAARCVCLCIVTNMTTEEYIQQFLEHIARELVIEKSTVSKNIRKRISASDDRASSEQVGFIGIMLVVIPVAFLVTLDLVPRG